MNNHFTSPLAQAASEMQHEIAKMLKRRASKRSGAHEASFTIDGVEVTVTYNEAGSYMPATETDPAEPPYKTLVSVIVGGQEVWGADADAWDDRFQLMAMVEEGRL